MERINEVLEGVKLYPKIFDRYINLSMCIDMRDSYQILFDESDYDKFIKNIKDNMQYRSDIIDKLNKRFHLDNYMLITNSTYDIWYFVTLTNDIYKDYTLLYVENVCRLNPKHFYEDYIDLFGNEVKFSE